MKKIVSMLAFFAVLGTLLFSPVSVGRAQVSIDLPPINTNTNPPFDPACIQAAVEKRDTAIISALDTYSAAIKTALMTRKNALVTAWGITDKVARRAALKAAWKNYRDSVRTIRKTFRDAKHASWRQFTADRKACKVTPIAEDSTGQGVDETL